MQIPVSRWIKIQHQLNHHDEVNQKMLDMQADHKDLLEVEIISNTPKFVVDDLSHAHINLCNVILMMLLIFTKINDVNSFIIYIIDII